MKTRRFRKTKTKRYNKKSRNLRNSKRHNKLGGMIPGTRDVQQEMEQMLELANMGPQNVRTAHPPVRRVGSYQRSELKRDAEKLSHCLSILNKRVVDGITIDPSRARIALSEVIDLFKTLDDGQQDV